MCEFSRDFPVFWQIFRCETHPDGTNSMCPIVRRQQFTTLTFFAFFDKTYSVYLFVTVVSRLEIRCVCRAPQAL